MSYPRRSDATLLLALIAATVAAFLILHAGFAPAMNEASAPAANALDVPVQRLSDDVVSGLPMDEHRALEAAQLSVVTVSRLKAWYLDCARSTSVHRMDVDEAVYCQAAAETLMHRHFNGSLEQLLSWWSAQAAPPQAFVTSNGT